MTDSKPNLQPAKSTGAGMSGYVTSAERVLSAIEGLSEVAGQINTAANAAVEAIIGAEANAITEVQNSAEGVKTSALKEIALAKLDIENKKKAALQAIAAAQSSSVGNSAAEESAKRPIEKVK